MATMLGFLTTDAQVDARRCCSARSAAVDDTFNAITVDGECSTNDCVFALAQRRERRRDRRATSYPALRRSAAGGLRAAGARHRPRRRRRDQAGHRRRHAARARDDDAKRRRGRSPTRRWSRPAIHGGDPNWGRLVAAAGRSGAAFTLDRARGPRSGRVELFSDGVPHDERAPRGGRVSARAHDIDVVVDLGTGGSGAPRMWTCDLSAEYVRINAEYRT